MPKSTTAATPGAPARAADSRRRPVRKLGENRAGFRRILVPLDGSDLAEDVLLHLGSLAAPGAEVVLVRAVASASQLAASAGGAAAPVLVDFVHLSEVGRHEAEGYLNGIATRLGELGLRVRTVVPLESASQAIVRTADDLDADLIAMTTHGRGGIERVVFGSVADAVTRSSSLPVFVVPVRESATAAKSS